MVFLNIYFLKNEEWYAYNENEDKYELTDKAPYEARISYEAYYQLEKEMLNDDDSSEHENKIMQLYDLVSQEGASQKYDEEQQARKIYGV